MSVLTRVTGIRLTPPLPRSNGGYRAQDVIRAQRGHRPSTVISSTCKLIITRRHRSAFTYCPSVRCRCRLLATINCGVAENHNHFSFQSRIAHTDHGKYCEISPSEQIIGFRVGRTFSCIVQVVFVQPTMT